MKRGDLGDVQAASQGAASGVCFFKCVSVWSRHMLGTHLCVEVTARKNWFSPSTVWALGLGNQAQVIRQRQQTLLPTESAHWP